VEYAYLGDDNVWTSIVGTLSLPGREPEPEPEIKRWAFCKGKALRKHRDASGWLDLQPEWL
jgi:hypothetical protein